MRSRVGARSRGGGGLGGQPSPSPVVRGLLLETARTHPVRAVEAQSHCYPCRPHLQPLLGREFASSLCPSSQNIAPGDHVRTSTLLPPRTTRLRRSHIYSGFFGALCGHITTHTGVFATKLITYGALRRDIHSALVPPRPAS